MRIVASILAISALGLPGYGQSVISLKAGLLNYLEGQIETTGPGAERPKANAFRLNCGEELRTRRGRAELLLDPTIFLRMDDRTHVSMESDTLGDVAVRILEGTAIVDAVDVRKDSHTRVLMGNQSFEIRHVGIYRFDAASGHVMVFDGKLDPDATHNAAIKKGHSWDVAAKHVDDFDEKKIDRFQRWSARRAVAVAQSNLILARSTYGYGWRRVTRNWQFSLRANLSVARTKVITSPALF